MLRSSKALSTRLSAALIILAAAFATSVVAPAAAQDGTAVTRPSCTACEAARKERDRASGRIERTRVRIEEERLTEEGKAALRQRSAADAKEIERADLVLGKCRNGCPASLVVKKVPPVKIPSCEACQAKANELAAIKTQIAQVEAEQAEIARLKRQASAQGKAAVDTQLRTLRAKAKAKQAELDNCEKKLCFGKTAGNGESAIGGAVKDIVKQLEGGKKKKQTPGGGGN